MNEITLYGTVGASWWDDEFFTPTTVRDKIAAMTGPLTVRINSGGGIATDGQTIYSILRDYPGTVAVVIDGIAASAASLIAMAGDTITMREGALMMIHDPAQPWTEGRGTEEDHIKAASVMAVISNAYAGVYAKRAGISVEAAREVMKAETYLNGPAAVAAGFATGVDVETEAVAVARFDYRLYAHAPEELRRASTGIPTEKRARSKEAVLAMMVGAEPPKPKRKEATMAKKTTMTKVKVTSEEEDKPTLEVEVDEEMVEEDGVDEDTEMEGEEGDDAEDDVEEDDIEEEDDAEAKAAVAVAQLTARSKKARAVVAMCRNLQRPMTDALAFIARGVTATAAGQEILAQLYKGDPMKGTNPRGGSTARITRDEGDTRRTGMGIALQARMGIKGVTVYGTPARPFMTARLSDLAAMSLGLRTMPNDTLGRLQVVMSATHTTSDFSAIFENALNKRLQQDYALALPTYREIAQRMDFTDYRPHPVAGVGELSPLTEITEGAEIKYGTINDKRESLTLKAYGTMAEITEQMIVNDDLGAIATVLARAGLVVAANEDAQFYAMMLGGSNADGPTLGETTRQMFNATDVTKAGTAAAITNASLQIGRAALMTKKSLGLLDLGLMPAILLVGPAKLGEAQAVLSDIQADAAANVNIFAGKLRIVCTPKITGNAWYLFAEPAQGANFAYGFLQGSEGPQVRNETPIGRLGMIYQVTHRFGCGGIDFRAGFKNAGA